MKHRLALLIAPALLAACAQSSGVHKMGPDTYSVSVQAAPARGGSAGARNVAFTEANEKCNQEGKEILVKNVSSSRINNIGAGSFEMTFQCLAKGDPDLQRPEYRGAPTAVIEAR